MTLVPVEERGVYTVAEAAERLNISRASCYEAVRVGTIPKLSLGGRSIRIPKICVERMLAVSPVDNVLAKPEPVAPELDLRAEVERLVARIALLEKRQGVKAQSPKARATIREQEISRRVEAWLREGGSGLRNVILPARRAARKFQPKHEGVHIYADLDKTQIRVSSSPIDIDHPWNFQLLNIKEQYTWPQTRERIDLYAIVEFDSCFETYQRFSDMTEPFIQTDRCELYIEIKAGTIDIDDLRQISSYKTLLYDKNRNRLQRLVLVASWKSFSKPMVQHRLNELDVRTVCIENLP